MVPNTSLGCLWQYVFASYLTHSIHGSRNQCHGTTSSRFTTSAVSAHPGQTDLIFWTHGKCNSRTWTIDRFVHQPLVSWFGVTSAVLYSLCCTQRACCVHVSSTQKVLWLTFSLLAVGMCSAYTWLETSLALCWMQSYSVDVRIGRQGFCLSWDSFELIEYNRSRGMTVPELRTVWTANESS